MVEVQTKIDLMKYHPYDIINMCDAGLVTVNEVIESQVAFACFSDILHTYLRTCKDELLEQTMVTNATVSIDVGYV